MDEFVLDASAVIAWMLEEGVAAKEGAWISHAGLDIEVLSVLRRDVLRGRLAPHEARESIDFLQDLQIDRHPLTRILDRTWALRHDITTYDAGYVALAEGLGVPLVTADRRLARTAQRYCEVVAL